MSDWSAIEALPSPKLMDLFAEDGDRLRFVAGIVGSRVHHGAGDGGEDAFGVEAFVIVDVVRAFAADHRDDVTDLLPEIPSQKNGKRVACIGAGPASLTVANDLMPLGYEVTIFEKSSVPGGLMRSNIPSFRLPEEVLNEDAAKAKQTRQRRSGKEQPS